MKVICELRYENSKKLKIITSIILILSTIFALKIRLLNEKTIKVTDFSQIKPIEFSVDLKERIIVNQEGVIHDSINRETKKEISEKTQKDIRRIINQLNEDQISEITSDLCDTIREEENNLAGMEELLASNESFGDF